VGAVVQAAGDGDVDDLGLVVGRGEHKVGAAFLPGQQVGRLAVYADEEIAPIIPTPHP